jgi:hypothetical protein
MGGIFDTALREESHARISSVTSSPVIRSGSSSGRSAGLASGGDTGIDGGVGAIAAGPAKGDESASKRRRIEPSAGSHGCSSGGHRTSETFPTAAVAAKVEREVPGLVVSDGDSSSSSSSGSSSGSGVGLDNTIEVTVPHVMKVCISPRWLDDVGYPRWIAERVHVYGLGSSSGGSSAVFDSITACATNVREKPAICGRPPPCQSFEPVRNVQFYHTLSWHDVMLPSCRVIARFPAHVASCPVLHVPLL